MENNELQMKQQTINDTLWRACDTFRGSIGSDQYKNYLLVMLFIKYISDVYKEHLEEYTIRYNGDKVRIERQLRNERFILDEVCKFDYLYQNRNKDNIGEIINKALEKFSEKNSKLRGVFEDVDYNNTYQLGNTKERNSLLKRLLEDFNTEVLDLRPSKIGNEDIIGNAYEYLIGKFASGAGKKGGEYFTPAEVSIVLAKIVKPQANDRIYDPSCGSGSLLLKAAKEAGINKVALYGQEKTFQTYALCRMNMFLHGVDDAEIERGDTLANPLHLENDGLKKFQVVVANPPFSLDKWAQGFDSASGSMETDKDGKSKDKFKMEANLDPYKRFDWGVPPSSKGDYAFVLHMVNSMSEDDGRMAVVLPHGILFRGASEGVIRRRIIEQENLLDAVIGLPENLFFGTGIPACIMVLKKNRKRNTVLIIDASKHTEGYDKEKNQNRLNEKGIQRIIATYDNYQAIDKYSYVATIDEIRENDFNLNIPRYVDTFEEEELVDMETVKENIKHIEMELQQVQAQMAKYLEELKLN